MPWSLHAFVLLGFDPNEGQGQRRGLFVDFSRVHWEGGVSRGILPAVALRIDVHNGSGRMNETCFQGVCRELR